MSCSDPIFVDLYSIEKAPLLECRFIFIPLEVLATIKDLYVKLFVEKAIHYL